MKKVLALLTLATATVSASANSDKAGAESHESSISRAYACEMATKQASRQAEFAGINSVGKKRIHVGSCDCQEDRSGEKWSCVVQWRMTPVSR